MRYAPPTASRNIAEAIARENRRTIAGCALFVLAISMMCLAYVGGVKETATMTVEGGR